MRKFGERLVKLWLLLVLITGGSVVAYSQEVRVISELNPSTILIGEQTNLKVRVVYPSESSVRLVLPNDTLVTGVEIVRSSLVDSMTVNNQLSELIYEVVITSFDSATYQLNNIQALVGGELVMDDDPPHLIVNTVPVDTTQPEQFFDIKEQWKPPFVWQDYLIYLYIVLGLLLLLLLTYWVTKRLKSGKNGTNERKEVSLLDPYTEAMTALNTLKEKELWEQNQVKIYYTELTDILRRYLCRVYGISTLDKTSSEILDEFRVNFGRERMYNELKEILETADLVKFAKFHPSSLENSSVLTASVTFVETHKPEEKEKEEHEKGGEES